MIKVDMTIPYAERFDKVWRSCYRLQNYAVLLQRRSRRAAHRHPERSIVVDHRERRVALLVDGSNLYFGAGEAGVSIHFARLLPFLKNEFFGGRVKVFRPYFYLGINTDPIDLDAFQRSEEESRRARGQIRAMNFLLTLIGAGYIVKARPVKVIGDKKKADLDTTLATDLLQVAVEEKYNTIVLMTGDEDFVAPIDKAMRANAHLEVILIGFADNTARALADIVDESVSIVDDPRFAPFVLRRDGES